MFLTERIISLLAYAFALLIAYQLIGKVTRKQYRAVLLIYLVVLAVFAFNYKPYVTADLYRLRQYMEYWIHKDLNGVIRYAAQSSAPAWILYSYIISKFGNINWLQTVTCLWCYGNVFFIVGHEIERNNIQRSFRSVLLFYIMAIGAFYLQTISGIRSMLGISIVSYCLYRETVDNKGIIPHLPLWVFAALLHPSTTILVLSRFVFLLAQNQEAVKKLLTGIVVLFLALFVFKYGNNFVSGSFEYGLGYINNSNEYSYSWEIIIGMIEICETAYVLRMFHIAYANDTIEHSYQVLYLFSLLWTVICVIILPFSYAIFRRYTMLCTVMTIPLVAKLFHINKINKNNRFRKTLFAFSMAIFVLSGVRGDLCGYKFFVLS